MVSHPQVFLTCCYPLHSPNNNARINFKICALLLELKNIQNQFVKPMRIVSCAAYLDMDLPFLVYSFMHLDISVGIKAADIGA